MINYNKVAMAGVDVLQLATGQRRKALESFLVLQESFIEHEMEEQVLDLLDEINAQLSDVSVSLQENSVVVIEEKGD